MVAPSSESVEYHILINAKEAVKNLREIMRHTEDNTEKMRLFSALVLDSAQRWGKSWQYALGVYKQLNQELSKSKKATLFGQTGGQDLFSGVESMLISSEKLRNSHSQTKKSLQDVGKATEDVGKKSQSAFQQAISGVNAYRIALGAVISMLLFQGIQAISTFFREAINQAKQFEDTLYRLRNVEESLSSAGIEISMAGLKKGIQDIQKLLPIFSKEDISQLVGNLAISTKQLGLNEQQLLDLAKAIGILNVRSEKQEDISTTAQHVLSSILTGNAKGITSLGIAFTDNVMRAKAMELGFLEAGEALSSLSENEKGITKLNIILASTADETANISEYLESNSAKLQQNQAAWKDLQTTVGQVILPFIPALTEFFKLIRDGFNGGKVIIIEFMTMVAALGVVMTAVFTGQITSIGQFTDVLKRSIDSFRETLVNQFFQEMPEDAPEWFKSGWGDLIKQEAETATGPVEDFGEAVESIDATALEKVADIFRDTANAVEDLANKMVQKLADLDTEYQRKAIDAQIDYQRKVEDINRDFERKRAEILAKHRSEDIKAEKEYQLKLWELRMRFLMDLEDALHARDARQVLRLMKQYKIDKEALRRKHALEEEEREANQKAELEALKIQREQRLADAKLEYEQRLADLNLAKQREQEDLAKWYMREFADLQLAQERKLQELLAGWAKEQQLTAENAAAIYAILQSYFGPGGLTDQLYKYMMESLLQTTQGAITSANAMLAGTVGAKPSTMPPPPTPTGGIPGARDMPFAEGGTLLATRPTRAIFGEGGPELVNFTPLSRIGKNIGKIFGNFSGGAGVNGEIRVAVDLSPDLEGRIVKQSMDGVASVVTKINRSKA